MNLNTGKYGGIHTCNSTIGTRNYTRIEDIDKVNDKSLEIYLFFINVSNKLHLEGKIMQTGHGSESFVFVLFE